MAPKSRGSAILFDAIVRASSTNRQHVCRSCRNNLVKARYASTATAQAIQSAPPITQMSSDEPAIAPDAQPRVTVKAGVVVSRPPLITPDPHPFETAFFLYQRRLNERLVLPFSQYFHFKRGTPAFEHWRMKRRERGGAAGRDIGNYNAYTKESWNDEALMGDDSANPRKIVEQLVDEEGRSAEFVGEDSNADTKLAGLKRTTDADSKQDQMSLERNLDRTLYLLVRQKSQQADDKAWRFPAGDVQSREGLKAAAERVLGSSCGVDMNTWFVASHPIGHCVEEVKSKGDSQAEQGQAVAVDSEATYFLKARIFAGQANLQGNSYGIQDFKWLTKQEIEAYVSPEYWTSIKNMLVEQ